MMIPEHDRAYEAVDALAQFYMSHGEIERAMYLLELLQRLDALPANSVATLGWCYSFFSKTDKLERLMATEPPVSESVWQERLRAVIDLLRGNFEQGKQRFEKTLASQSTAAKLMFGIQK